ncbi:MAG TPA: hydantoinase B/oxoprolinase family protein [Stellaceae bacterium]|nr:hydantoinase B/oxoprolinase family protein [Stellaceae bacterium]
MKCALLPSLPNNEGMFRPITVTAPEGTLLNPTPPIAVGGPRATRSCWALPGGGGYGSDNARPEEARERDRKMGYVNDGAGS